MKKGLLPALISGLVFASTATGNPQSIEGIDSFLENDIEDLNVVDNKLRFTVFNDDLTGSDKYSNRHFYAIDQHGVLERSKVVLSDFDYEYNQRAEINGTLFITDDGLLNGKPIIMAQNSLNELEVFYEFPNYDNNDPSNPGSLVGIPDISAIYEESGQLMVELYKRDYSLATYGYFELISLNPITAQATVISDNYGSQDARLSPSRFLFSRDNDDYYVAETSDYGEEFWKSSGTNANRQNIFLADVNPGAASSYAENFVEFKGELYFIATSSGAGGRELWKMDSNDNIQRVADIYPGGAAFSYSEYYFDEFIVFNDELFFFADHPDYGKELWKTDGTEAGTVLVADTASGSQGVTSILPWMQLGDYDSYSKPTYDLLRLGLADESGFYFRVQHSQGASPFSNNAPSSLWFSDGSSNGTKKVLDEPTTYRYTIGRVAASFYVNDSFFVAYRTNESSEGQSLWRIGKGANPQPELIIENVSSIRTLGLEDNRFSDQGLFFVKVNDSFQLWKTDGTKTGTKFLKDVADDNSTDGASLVFVSQADNKTYFVAWNDDTGRELWITDGTAAGTHIVKDINPGPESSIVRWSENQEPSISDRAAVLDGRLYFHAFDENNGMNLWLSDGTSNGTEMIESADYSLATSWPVWEEQMGNPKDFTSYEGSYYFTANEDGQDAGAEQLYKYTPESTTPPPATGTGSLGDFVWIDTNANGIQDASELGLENVTVELQSCSGDFVASTTSDSMGAYRFENVAEDHFQLQFILPSGYEFSPEKATAEFKLDSNANETTGTTPCYDMTQGYQRLAVDAGMVPVASTNGDGLLGDFVWQDTNGDGIQDANEPGLAGVTVNLQSCNGSVVNSMDTDSNGKFAFENIGAGDYRLEFELLDGFSFSPEKSTDLFQQDSNANEASGVTPCYNMDTGWKRRAVDAGMVPHNTAPADSVSVVKAIYFSAQNKLWVRATSDAEPQGSAYLTASVEVNGSTTELGQIDWKSDKGFYQTNFRDLPQAPSTITIMSDLGGLVTVEIEIQ